MSLARASWLGFGHKTPSLVICTWVELCETFLCSDFMKDSSTSKTLWGKSVRIWSCYSGSKSNRFCFVSLTKRAWAIWEMFLAAYSSSKMPKMRLGRSRRFISEAPILVIIVSIESWEPTLLLFADSGLENTFYWAFCSDIMTLGSRTYSTACYYAVLRS